MANKDVLGEVGITNEEIIEFEKKCREWEKIKVPTAKARAVDEILNILLRLTVMCNEGISDEDIEDRTELSVEYNVFSAIITLEAYDVMLFANKSLKMLQAVLLLTDDFIIEIDDTESGRISVSFVVDDVFTVKQ